MNNYEKLLDLFEDARCTQKMRQSINLLGLRYIRIKDLMLLHGFYEKLPDRSVNPLFSAPVRLFEIERDGDKVNLTIEALRDDYDERAVSLVRGMERDEAEPAFSHLRPEFLSPVIRKEGWDNWTFSYSAAAGEKLKLRRDKTFRKMTILCRSLHGTDFEGKRVLFLGCGDGDEVSAFAEYFKPRNAAILGIDQSEKAVENCAALRDSFGGLDVSFMRMDFDDMSNLPGGKFDFVFAIGIFDRETLSFEDGQALLEVLREKVDFDSLITSSYSFDLFTSRNYSDMGYAVKACCEPSTLYTNDYSFYYHLSKSGAPAAVIKDSVAEESLKFFS